MSFASSPGLGRHSCGPTGGVLAKWEMIRKVEMLAGEVWTSSYEKGAPVEVVLRKKINDIKAEHTGFGAS